MTTRRGFLHWTAAAVTALALPPSAFGFPSRSRPRHPFSADVILRGALVYDGTGAPPFEADVAVTADRISAVGPALTADHASVLDLSGLALAPGFIDIHSHSDLELLIDPRAESKVRQGVTTEVAGQDGGSMGPWRRQRAKETGERYRTDYGIELSFRDLGGFFAHLQQQPPAVNFASMVGHGTIREYVLGAADRLPTPQELKDMQRLAGEAIRQGACGLSSGLEYLPGAFANPDELIALVSTLQGTGLPYASHMRNEDDQLFAAVEEALTVGSVAGVPVHISHLKAQGQRNWWKARPVLEMLAGAQASGIDVTYDRYPYVAYSTGLSSLFPVWVREGGADVFLDRLRDPRTASRMQSEVQAKINSLGSWDAVQITSTASPDLAWAVGRRLGALAAERGVEPYALLLQIIRGDRSRTGMVGFGMSEENTALFLSHPLGMLCSDGSALATDGALAGGTPHPRNYGAFPRVLGYYCREQNVMPLELAIHKMSAMPARRLGLEGRGTVSPGAFADIVVFDPDIIADRATFDRPHQYPVGVQHVMVNGRFVIREGAHTGELPGRVVRPGK